MAVKKQVQETEDSFEKALIEMREDANVQDVIPITSIWQSLSDFQQDVPILTQNTEGYNYKYVDLAEIIKVIKPYLKKYNLGFTQPLEGNGMIRTIIYHTVTGQTLESVVAMPMDVQLKGMNDYQVFGSAISYFRRYSLVSILGLISEKDNDASGEQIKKVAIPKTLLKPILTEGRFNDALIAINNNEYKAEDLKKKYQLSELQINIINSL